MGVKIKEIPKSERPYERLAVNGASSLSNEELLAVLLKTGTKGISSKDVAQQILIQISNISDLSNINYEKLNQIKGVGMVKACSLLAAVELGKRINCSIESLVNKKFNNSNIVYEFYKQKIGDEKQENFYCVYLDNSKKIIREKLLFKGTINYSVVHPREVFKEAYLLSASSIICVHNHPSGNALPSKQDLDVTNTLVAAGKILGINVIDHIIITKKNYYSFLENGDIVF